jgi:hypothetical protein
VRNIEPENMLEKQWYAIQAVEHGWAYTQRTSRCEI